MGFPNVLPVGDSREHRLRARMTVDRPETAAQIDGYGSPISQSIRRAGRFEGSWPTIGAAFS